MPTEILPPQPAVNPNYLSDYFGPDVTDKATFHRPSSEWQDGERRLMAGVLEQAVADAGLKPKMKGGKNRTPKERATNIDAMQWFIEEPDEENPDYVFSFITICEAFDYAPEPIRRATIKAWTAAHGYVPTVDVLEQRQKAILRGHHFIAMGHCPTCDLRMQRALEHGQSIERRRSDGWKKRKP